MAMSGSASATIPVIDGMAMLILDALPDASVVLEPSGVIIAVNRAWRMFTLDQGGDPASTGVGVNYLDVCVRAAASGSADAAEVVDGLRAVLKGKTSEVELDYSCPSPGLDRWFLMRISPLGDGVHGAVVSHVNITRRKIAERELAHEASHDPLTGLANRTLLHLTLTKALSRRSPRRQGPDVGLLYIDLDRFKEINDTYGHAVGDEILMLAAERLRSLARPNDLCARVGGDELVLLLPRISEAGLATVAERTKAELSRPHMIHQCPVRISASVGSYLAGPGTTATEALNFADMAMYAVKREHRRAR